jgi:hypothetical protein
MDMRQLWTLLLVVTWASSAAAAGGTAFSEPWRAGSEPVTKKTNESTLKRKKGYEGPQGTQRRVQDEARKMSKRGNRTGRVDVGLNGVERLVPTEEKGLKQEGKGLQNAKPKTGSRAPKANGQNQELKLSTLAKIITGNTSPKGLGRERKRMDQRRGLPNPTGLDRIRLIRGQRGVAIGIGPQ